MIHATQRPCIVCGRGGFAEYAGVPICEVDLRRPTSELHRLTGADRDCGCDACREERTA